MSPSGLTSVFVKSLAIKEIACSHQGRYWITGSILLLVIPVLTFLICETFVRVTGTRKVCFSLFVTGQMLVPSSWQQQILEGRHMAEFAGVGL